MLNRTLDHPAPPLPPRGWEPATAPGRREGTPPATAEARDARTGVPGPSLHRAILRCTYLAHPENDAS